MIRNDPLFGPGEEFRLIERMVRRLGTVAQGIGDDAAILEVPKNEKLVVSTDTSVEGVHFKREWFTSLEIGYRAGASALSDLAAMAAEPLAVVVAMTVPRDWRADIDGLSGGIGAAAKDANTQIVGGDTTQGDRLSITITALGTVREPLLRSSARVGDSVYVTGRFGGPGAALKALLADSDPEPEHLARFAMPSSRINEARWLVGKGAHAGIDISDGLLADVSHIAAASNVRIALELSQLPVFMGLDPLEAARSGEEYELLVTSQIPIETTVFHERFGIPLTKIGTVEDGTAGVAVTLNGKTIDVNNLSRGFDHFGDA